MILDEGAGSPEIASQISTVMVPALGIDPDRGDAFSVQLIPFDDSWREDFEGEGSSGSPFRFSVEPGLVIAVLGGVALLLVLIVAVRAIARTAHSRPQPVLMTTEAALTEAMEKRIPKEVDHGKRQKARQLGEEEPENMALLLKTWLAEE